MKERPILFSAPMVRAILEGRKTQTRRIVKPQPEVRNMNLGYSEIPMLTFKRKASPGYWLWPNATEQIIAECPHGKPGDRLYVRETWSHTGTGVWSVRDAQSALDGRVIYAATDPAPCKGCWFPSIHMPRIFSRITLELTDVRVERLNDISEEDAKAEGCEESWSSPHWSGYIRGRNNHKLRVSHGCGQDGKSPPNPELEQPEYVPAELLSSAKEHFSGVWFSINGSGPNSWSANPWVWVESFKVIA